MHSDSAPPRRESRVGISFAPLLQRGIGERTARKLPSTWIGFVLTGEDAQARVLGNAWLGPNRIDADECEFDSRHPSCVNFLWADGHFAPVADAIDAALYRDLARRN